MGGKPSLPMAVQCVPDRVLRMILDYSCDLYIGVLETSDIKLRPSSRHITKALCVNWWRVVRASRATSLTIERDLHSPPQRCSLTRVRVWDDLSMSHSTVTFAGNCGLMSNSYLPANFNMSSSREPGVTVWIWDQQHVAVWNDGQCIPEIRSAAALTHFRYIAAVNRKYILATREALRIDEATQHLSPTRDINVQVFDLVSLMAPSVLHDPVASGNHLPPLEVSIMAASFVDAASSEFLVVAHDFAVYRHGEGAKHWCPETLLGNLMAGQQEDTSRNAQVKTYAWSCALLYEAGYVFSFCAKLPDGSFFFHMCRFATDESSRLTIKTSWKSHSNLSCTSFDLQAAARTDCNIDIAPSDSSLLIYQSYEILVAFDRKTLCGIRQGLRLSPTMFSRVVCKSVPSSALSVVVDGIRLSKEKRLGR